MFNLVFIHNIFCHNIWVNKNNCLISVICIGLSEAQRFRGGRRQGRRRGRQEGGDYIAPEAGDEYLAPAASDEYASPSEDVPVYEGGVPVYGADDAAGDDPLAALANNIPGVPGEDYPIFAEVPESGFSCEGQVDGGYYADPEAECQVFHICTADVKGGLSKYSFLCPNGTIFNQNYFICDWWFNFDCSEAEGLYSLNDDIAAERAEIDALAAAASDQAVYGAPIEEYAAAPAVYEAEAPADEYQVARGARRLANRRNNRRQSSRSGRQGTRGGRRSGRRG